MRLKSKFDNKFCVYLHWLLFLESLPCKDSKEFFYLNDRIGKEKELLHTDADVEKLATFFGSKEE